MATRRLHYSIVVAYADNQVIGRNNHLPWHLSDDLKHFKALTLGKTMLMGRKTYESIGKLLPGRQTVILTHNLSYHIAGADVIHGLDQLENCSLLSEEIMVVGGAAIYAQLLPLCETLYVTEVKASVEGDAFFPKINEAAWREVSRQRHKRNDTNDYDADFVQFVRRTSS